MIPRRPRASSTHVIARVVDSMPAIKKLFALSALISCTLLGVGVTDSTASLSRKAISSFNGAGTDAGPFEEIRRIAIHQSSGTVYVLDNQRQSQFAIDAVVDKLNENGVAEDFTALGSSSLSGADVSPPTTFRFERSADIAVDNSATATNGRFYVLEPGGDPNNPPSTYFAFDSSGAYLYRVTVPGSDAACGITVDSGGDVWVGRARANSVVEYNSAGTATGATITTQHEACNLAFDTVGNLYVAGNGDPGIGFGIDGLIEKYNAAGVFQYQVDSKRYTDIAADPSTNDVLGTRNDVSEIKEFDSAGALTSIIHRPGALSIAMRGSPDHAYVADSLLNAVHVFGPLVAVPVVTTDAASNVEDATATLNGTVEPDGIPITDCHFEYVGNIDFESGDWASPAVHFAPCVPASIPDGGATAVSAAINRPDIGDHDTEAFHFRLVAENADGAGEGLDRVVGFGITDFDAEVLQANGEPATQAGGHPSLATQPFHINTLFTPFGRFTTSESIRNVTVDLPPGVVGNPQALPTCSVSDFSIAASTNCPPESQVGVVRLSRVGFEQPFGLGTKNPPGTPDEIYAGLYNLKAPSGTTGLLGFSIINLAPNFVAVRVRSGTDYGLTFDAVNASQGFDLNGVIFDTWGVPAESVHDPLRGNFFGGASGLPKAGWSEPYEGEPTAFLTLPTSCLGPQNTSIRVQTWEGDEDRASFLSHDTTKPVPNPVGTEGCNTLDFSPSLEARPTTNVADSPSGLSVDLEVPQSDIANPESTAEAHLRDATVTLPEGLVINPSGANGLGGCSPDEIGLTSAIGETPVTFTPDAAHCPDPSRIGTAEITTPLLDHPLPGGVFVATPYENPFGSLLAIYIAVYDPQSGLVLKFPGRLRADPVSGRLTTLFEENPQLPFSSLKLNVNGGSAAPLRTPETCGIYSTTSSLTPWSAPDSGPPATPSDTYAIEQGALGGTCPTSSAGRAHSPSIDAGTTAPLAGKDSPLVINLRREDGSQQFSAVTLKAPPGLSGKLAGIPYCPEAALALAATKDGKAEEAAPSCPATSQVGNVYTAAGAGPAPYNAPGKAYLTGPYKGAPLSLAIVTPATAGPFDLGTIVVRAALQVDPVTAQITAVSDPIPTILEGIPLDVRSVQVRLDRPEFTRNPTSCDPMAFDGQLTSTLGQPALLSSRFQVGECGRLDFEPKMSLRLKGPAKRLAHPALTATLTTRPGDANLADISVAMPGSILLDQAHIGTVCTRVQFAASNCPAASIYGEATVSTPLLDYELSGPVYLRSSSNELPDLVPDLRGPANQPIKLEAAGRTDSIKGGIRNTFSYVPDAPFSKLTLSLQGGKKGLLQNSVGLCAKTHRATVKFGAHNGLRLTAHPALKTRCGKAKKRHKRKRHANRRAAR